MSIPRYRNLRSRRAGLNRQRGEPRLVLGARACKSVSFSAPPLSAGWSTVRMSALLASQRGNPRARADRLGAYDRASGGVFLALFAVANPVVAGWLAHIELDSLLAPLDLWRIAFSLRLPLRDLAVRLVPGAASGESRRRFAGVGLPRSENWPATISDR